MKLEGLRHKLVYGLALTLPLWLVACKHGPEDRAEKIVARVASKLDLNEAQRAKLEEIKQQILQIQKERRAQREADFQEAMALISAKELDTKKVKDLVAKRRDTVQDVLPAVVDKIAELHAMLDDKQKAKIVKFMEQLHSRRSRGG